MKILLTVLLFSLSFARPVEAFENEQFITIVNPVRISSYTPDPKESIESEYAVVSQNELPATWLLTYDVLLHGGAYEVAREMDDRQELGIWLEVTPAFTEAAGVTYNESGSWHHADSIFLSGYSQEDRRKLIDLVFEKFKERFGYYPTSVGSWWTDAFSLRYIKDKYGVTANLGVADQFSIDGYQVWGQYWSTPFYPSKNHPAIPASTSDSKIDVVNLQWAARDPLHGYFSSLYSTQDYSVPKVNLKMDYYQKLIDLFARKRGNEFGQITVGLEGDFPGYAYRGLFAREMELIKRLGESGEFTVTNMKDFSGWYRGRFKLPPPHVVETSDLLGEEIKVIWYQSPRYRIGLTHNFKENQTKIFDFRTYHPDFTDPYELSPNRDKRLHIYIPSVFDEINNPEDVWPLSLGSLSTVAREGDRLKVGFESGEIAFSPEGLRVSGEKVETPAVLRNHPLLLTNSKEGELNITVKDQWLSPREGVLLNGLTPEATHFLLQRKVTLGFLTAVVFLSLLSFAVRRLLKNPGLALALQILFFLPLVIVPVYWHQKNTIQYYVGQQELDALSKLSLLPPGRVMVFDNECLQCSYSTARKPAFIANKRSYVQNYSKQPIVYNSSVFSAETREQARREFIRTGAKYVYLVKFEGYKESLPFSPGDIGVIKIYENANAEIWRAE